MYVYAITISGKEIIILKEGGIWEHWREEKEGRNGVIILSKIKNNKRNYIKV